MKSYPDSETVLSGLGDKIIEGLSQAVVRTARDLRQYRTTFPQWVSQASERGLANWIHDRIWWHVTALFDSMPGVEVSDREPTREVVVGLNYRLRLKRHHEDGDLSTYPTPTALDFYLQGIQYAFPGMEEVRLAAGYEWDKETREMGAAVLSMRDGRENIVWKVTHPEIDDGLGGVTSVPPVTGPTPPTIETPAVDSKRVKDQE
jgi:hypothetical protein